MPWPSMKATMSSFAVVRSSGVGDILGKARKQILYAVRPRGASVRAAVCKGRSVSGRGRRRWHGHQADKHAIELFCIEVNLNFDRMRAGPQRTFGFPGERVAVAGAVIDVHAHETRLTFRN